MPFLENFSNLQWSLYAVFVVLVMVYGYFYGERRWRAIPNFCRRNLWIPVVLLIIVVNGGILLITGPKDFPSGTLLIISGVASIALLGHSRTQGSEGA